MCLIRLFALSVLLVQLALCQNKYVLVKRYHTEFAVSVVIAVIFLVTSIFFLYKWIKTYRSVNSYFDQRIVKSCYVKLK